MPYYTHDVDVTNLQRSGVILESDFFTLPDDFGYCEWLYLNVAS